MVKVVFAGVDWHIRKATIALAKLDSPERSGPIRPRRGHRRPVFLGPMTSPDVYLSKGRRGRTREMERENEWQSESSHMDLWWGADTDRACDRLQQFKSNLRHDHVSWLLSRFITSSFSSSSATSRPRVYRNSPLETVGRQFLSHSAECRSLQIDK